MFKLDRQHVAMVAHGGRDLRSISTSGDNGMAGIESGFGDVNAQASANAGDEPNSLFTHGMSLS